MEDLHKLFNGKITTEIGFPYHPEYMELINRKDNVEYIHIIF
jgi:hypothetical protein